MKAILFDMDGVLTVSEDIWEEAEEEFLSRRGHHFDRERLKPKMVGTSILASTYFLKEELKLEGEIEDIMNERIAIVNVMLKEKVTWMQPSLEFLKRVKDKYKIAIGTSCGHQSLAVINSVLKLDEYFGEHIYSVQDADNKSKPAPDVYLLAAHKLGVDPADCVVIEDAPLGIDAAHAAGMKCIAVTSTMGKEAVSHADWVVDTLAEVDWL